MARKRTPPKTNSEINSVLVAQLFEWKNLDSELVQSVLKKMNRKSRKDADEYFDLLKTRRKTQKLHGRSLEV